jgi:DNA-directed RNA polymerase alpha subunit
MTTPIEDIPDLTVRTYSVLKRNDINTVEQIKAMTYKEISSLRNMPRKSIEELEKRLGIEFYFEEVSSDPIPVFDEKAQARRRFFQKYYGH